jgi:hypothetical protein
LSESPITAKGAAGVLSAIGVVLSLAFVGFELRQNTAAVKASAIQELSAQSVGFLTDWATDETIPALLARTASGALPNDFSAEENQRLTLIYLAALRAYEARFIQVQLGVLDDAMFESMAGSSAFYERPWLKARWGEIFETSLGPEFAAYFKSRFGID